MSHKPFCLWQPGRDLQCNCGEINHEEAEKRMFICGWEKLSPDGKEAMRKYLRYLAAKDFAAKMGELHLGMKIKTDPTMAPGEWKIESEGKKA